MTKRIKPLAGQTISPTAEAPKPGIAANLKAARIHAGYTSALQASNAHGWAQRTYYNHEAGVRQFTHLISLYAKAFKVRPSFLTGEASPTITEIPHLDFTSIRGESLEKTIEASRESIFAQHGCGPKCFTIANPDKSMTAEQTPLFLPTDILGFDPSKPIRPGDYVLAWIDGLAEVAFRVYWPKGRYGASLHALNSAVEPIEVTKKSQWQPLARLQFLIRPSETLG